MDALLNFVYYLTWVYPVFTLSKILNGIYYQVVRFVLLAVHFGVTGIVLAAVSVAATRGYCPHCDLLSLEPSHPFSFRYLQIHTAAALDMANMRLTRACCAGNRR